MPSSALTTAPGEATTPAGPLATLRSDLEKRAADFRLVLPSHIDPGKFQRTVLTAAQSNPDLLRCERRSLITACFKAAQDSLLPDGREAAIVPFNHRYKDADGWHTAKLAQYLPMVFGLRKKILQSGEIRDIHAGVVYRQEIESGRFVYEEGTERILRHKPIVEPDFAPTDEDIALAYSVATYRDARPGDPPSIEVMRRWEIDEVREASQTGSQYDSKGNPREAKGPWVEWFSEMAKKTVIRRHSKSLPMSGDVIADIEADDIAFAAKSAVALLDSRKADDPEAVPEHDPETGEIGAPEPEPDDRAGFPETQPEPNPAPKPRQRRRGADATQPAPDATEGPENAPEAALDAPEAEQLTEGPEPAPIAPPANDEDEPDANAGTEYGTDEYGITKDPNEAAAESFIERAGKCELLLDLRALETEADLVLAAMPGDIAGPVDEAFARARQRLTPPPKAG